MHVAVIGAGFAGLATGKVLTQFGHEVTIFEKAPDVGGVWSETRRYPGLSTQNDKGTYALSDLPMPKDYPEWPSGEQVQHYLADYATKFGLTSYLRLGTEVTAAVLDEAAVQWTISAKGPQGSTSEETYDYLVVANGIFSEPSIPSYEGFADHARAGGRVCAPSDVHDLSDVEGRDVLVVGYGKSACDIAAAITGSARSSTVVARQLMWKMPKKIQGLLNFKYLMLTRLGEALFEYQDTKGFEKFLHGRGKAVRNGMLGSLQSVATRQLKLRENGLVPDGAFERIGRSTVSLTTDGFYEKVHRGELTVVRDNHVVRLLERDGRPMAELSNGTTLPADVVICATGWLQGVPFLDDALQNRLTDERGNFELYQQILPHDIPGLAFAGYNSSFYSPLSAEVAALWIANHLMGASELPPIEDRRLHVQERLKWMEERTEGHHARGTNLIPFSMHNIDETLEDIGITLSRAQRVREWLMPVDPSTYRAITTTLLERRDKLRG